MSVIKQTKKTNKSMGMKDHYIKQENGKVNNIAAMIMF